jgi:hypothetical protein
MTKVFLAGGSYQSQSLIASAQRSLNLYAEEIPAPQGEPQPTWEQPSITHTNLPSYVYYPAPGLTALGGSRKGLAFANITPMSVLMEGPPAVVPGVLACGQAFKWEVPLIDNSDTHTTQTDVYNNFVFNYAVTAHAVALRPSDGTIIWDYTPTTLLSDINAWLAATFGASPIAAVSPGNQIFAAPICGGQYIVMMFKPVLARTFEYWTAIYSPSVSGNPTLLGAVYFDGLISSPYLQLHMLSVAGAQTADDPLLYVGSFAVTGEERNITVLPSVNQIINLTYNLDSHGASQPVVTPGLIANQTLFPIATNALSEAFYQKIGLPSYGVPNMVGAWFMPGASGGTNMYCYFSRLYMDWNANYAIGPNTNLEVRGLAPTWPLGVVLKIQLGVVAWTNISGQTATPAYTVDNASWGIVGGLPVVPFRDEYSNLRLGTAGTTLDAYQMKPGIVQPIVSGALAGQWLVGMTMSGMEQLPPTAATYKYQALRMFAYDPSAETFTQIGSLACPVYQYSSLGGFPSFYDDNEQLFYLSGSDVMMYGQVNSPSRLAYLVKFGTITLP